MESENSTQQAKPNIFQTGYVSAESLKKQTEERKVNEDVVENDQAVDQEGEDDNNEEIEMEDLNEFRNKELNFEKPEAQKVRKINAPIFHLIDNNKNK